MQKEELNECTFKPQINREFKSPKLRQAQSPKQQPLRSPTSQQDKANKTRSRELMPHSGNKHQDLYELSKIMKERKRMARDKTTIEYEFEKHQKDCTFKPQINKASAAKPRDRRSPGPVPPEGNIMQLRGA